MQRRHFGYSTLACRLDRLALPGLAGSAERLGIYGLGAAGHIVARLGTGKVGLCMPSGIPMRLRRKNLPVVAPSDHLADILLDAAIIYAPAGELVPAALRAVRRSGRVVCAVIHMSDIPSFPYALLWEERQLVSVANLTRQDGLDFFKIVSHAGIRTQITAFPLVEANEVHAKLRTGQILGAAVLQR